jgi:Ribbon-helix-helix protein, copG family
MAQKPLSPEGGRAPFLRSRVAHADFDRLDRAARRLGLTRSEYVRSALLERLDRDEAEEATAKAS